MRFFDDKPFMRLNYRDEGDDAPEADMCRTESEDRILVTEGFLVTKNMKL